MVRYYRRMRKLDQADEMYRKEIAYDPHYAWNYGNYAQFLLCEKDDYDAAIGRARQALAIMNYGAGRYWLAAALYRKWAQSLLAGSVEAAAPYFVEAQSLYPNPAEIAGNASSCPPLGHVAEALKRNTASPDVAGGKRRR
jgi:tetratricopeptide (TPR) repeat protein